MHPPLRSVDRENLIGNTRWPTGMKWIDPRVHLPQHAAHSWISTNKRSGFAVITVGFSITHTHTHLVQKKNPLSDCKCGQTSTTIHDPVGFAVDLSGHQGAELPNLSACCGNFPQGIFFEKQEVRRFFQSNPVSVVRVCPHFRHFQPRKFHNCEFFFFGLF